MLQSHLRKQRLEKPKCLWACAMTFQSCCLWNGCFKDRVYSYSQTGAFSVTFARQHSDKEAVRQNQVGSYMQSLCDVRVTAINCDELMKITNLLSPYIDIQIRAHTEPRIWKRISDISPLTILCLLTLSMTSVNCHCHFESEYNERRLDLTEEPKDTASSDLQFSCC